LLQNKLFNSVRITRANKEPQATSYKLYRNDETMDSPDSSTPTIHLITLLHQDTALHSEGTTNLKATYWNLTKARQKRGFQAGGGGFGGVEYSVNDVREELRAQAVLDREEPELIEENDDNLGKGSVSNFVLHFDGGKALRGKSGTSSGVTKPEKKETDGLRRRGNAPQTTNNTESEKWTEEMADEEEQLRSADPLTLFGVPPADLRVAQARSRDAIAYYVEVANLAQEILRLTCSEKSL
jgi:hypothetical protein